MKNSVWVLWVGSVAAAAFGEGAVATGGQVAFWLTLVAHLVEFGVKLPLFRRIGGPLGGHFTQTMIYGLFYWQPLERELDESDG